MSRKKPRLPLHQIFFFSVGHVMNDLVAAIFYSYLLTFQTKVLALPNSLVGFLWLIPQAVDAFLAVVIGYISDNCSIPFFSAYYGKRKTLHLIGCTMVGIFTPFLLMPCFICDKGDYESWKVVAYYVVLLIFAYSGWGLTQANFLTLIPEMATRQSEMVKLGAISSAVTLIGGIYVYVVTWVLLGNDGADSLSYKQRNEFMGEEIHHVL